MTKTDVSYKQLKQELDKLLVELQRDDLDVEEALELYKKGQSLISDLEEHLKTAENTVKQLKAKFNK